MNLTKKIIGLSLAIVIGFAYASLADDGGKGGKKSLESRIAELEAKLKDAGVGGGVKGSGIKVSGYVDTSYLVNLTDRSRSGPVGGSTVQNTGRVFDKQFNAFNLNAVKLTIEKSKSDKGLFPSWPAGFRVDTILGEDANVLDGAAGVNDSRLFLEQAYVNLDLPVGNGIDFKVGKMVSLIGYEVIESPANWQFSRSEAFRLAPKTQTGVTVGYQWNDIVTTTVGIINGVDSGTAGRQGGLWGAGNGAVNFNTAFAAIGRVDITGPKTDAGDFNSFIAGYYGNDNDRANANTAQNISMWNVGGTWSKPFNVKELGFGADYLGRHDDMIGDWASANATSFYGKWDWNNWTTTSARMSYAWYNTGRGQGALANANTLSPLVPYTVSTRASGDEIYSFTLTQAFNVWKDTLVRLEWRRDWTPSGVSGFGVANAAGRDDIRQDQDTIGVNVVYSF